jgi:uncharacterized protein (DUF362 family)
MDSSRREFIQRILAVGGVAIGVSALLPLLNCSNSEYPATADNVTTPPPPPPPPPGEGAYMAVARGTSPKAMVEAALRALGGIERFVRPGHNVVIKPNICVAYRTPEYAATTNPEVVAALVAICLGAGARSVRVMDYPFGGTAEEAYVSSGIAKRVQDAGGQMEVMSRMKFQDTPIPDGRKITSWPIYQPVLDADVLIDVPIAKHHGLATLTLGMKNLLGVVLNPGQLHTDLAEKVTDLTSVVRPHLTVVDAVRILLNNGPQGGSLNDVKQTDTIIASHDIVAADSYASTLFGLTPDQIPTIRAGARRGLGTMDLSAVEIEEIRVD